ncbi:hypothetical protein [Streptomyces sp. NPDC014894]|uniref:hypothetical protein n=1 Tax=unclassified Streptomyces TaxID=2593676 RepID=UPI0036F66A47
MVFSHRIAALAAVVAIPLGIAVTSYALTDSPDDRKVPPKVELQTSTPAGSSGSPGAPQSPEPGSPESSAGPSSPRPVPSDETVTTQQPSTPSQPVDETVSGPPVRENPPGGGDDNDDDGNGQGDDGPGGDDFGDDG